MSSWDWDLALPGVIYMCVLYTLSLVSHTPIPEIILDLVTPGVGVEENVLSVLSGVQGGREHSGGGGFVLVWQGCVTHKHLLKLIHEGKSFLPFFCPIPSQSFCCAGVKENEGGWWHKRTPCIFRQFLEVEFGKGNLKNKEDRQKIADAFPKETKDHFDVDRIHARVRNHS
jgi:hypothetical protein